MSEDPIPFDSVLDLCQDQYRRIVLQVLVEERRSLKLGALTKAILRADHQMSFSGVSGDVSTEIRLSLHHVHLPKLATEGFIDYDPERKIVEPTEWLAEMQQTLCAVLDADPLLKVPIEA